MIETRVILIGAGPIGLELALGLKDAGIEYLHFDARQLGHTISWFPRQVHFFSSPERIAICGVPLMTAAQDKATREEYLAYLTGVARQFELPIQTYERVTSIAASDSHRFSITTRRADGEHVYVADNVVFAIGDMHRPRSLDVPGGDLEHVSHYFVEPHPYVGQRLLIVGGQNSAVEAAIRCHRAGARVAISYRKGTLPERIKYWLKPEIEWLIEKGAIEFFPNTRPVRIAPSHVSLAATNPDGEFATPGDERDVAADFVLAMIGYEMDGSLLEQAGVELYGDSRTPRFDPETMQTNVDGLFVAGTAAAGTQQRFRLFIENCHSHVVRIVRALGGSDPRRINSLAYGDLAPRNEE